MPVIYDKFKIQLKKADQNPEIWRVFKKAIKAVSILLMGLSVNRLSTIKLCNFSQNF